MTAVASDSYSRMVAWLKVIFPLAALALLSTLFLLSRSIDPQTQIPFADKEIKERLRDQHVTGPFFTGTTTDGDQISFAAEKLTTPEGQTGAHEALDIRVDMDLAGGGHISLSADQASFELAKDRAELTGAVWITTSNGYRLRSDRLVSEMTALNLISPGPVEGEGPAGQLSAGGMTLTAPKSGNSTQLIFTNGVKLVYTPRNAD